LARTLVNLFLGHEPKARVVTMWLVARELGFSTLLWIACDGISPLETNKKTSNPMYK